MNLAAVIFFAYLIFTLLECFLLREVKGLTACFAMLCASLILLKASFVRLPVGSRLFPVLLSIFFCLVTGQFLYHEEYSYLEYFASLSWIACPLAVYLLGIRRDVILWILGFLWFANLAASLRQLEIGAPFVGLPGNLNWQASLVAGLSPVVFYLFGPKPGYLRRSVSSALRFAVIAFACFAIIKTQSRATALAAVFALAIFAFSRFAGRPRARLIFSAAIILFISVSSAIAVFFQEDLAKILHHDMRPAMWKAGADLFFDNPLFGVGDNSYLSAYTAYRPIGYFLRSHHFAYITEHPHNHILYMLGSFGVIGGVPVLVLIFQPLLLGFGRIRSLSSGSRAVFFSLLILIAASMFDMTYYHWHNFFAISLLLGLAWKTTYPLSFDKKAANYAERPSLFFRLTQIACAAILLAAFAASSVNVHKSSALLMRGRAFADNPDFQSLALISFDRASRVNPNLSQALFGAGTMSIQYFNDPYMAEYYFGRLRQTPLPRISRSNLKMAEAMIALGRRLEAVACLREDALCYPISIESLYKRLEIERSLGWEDAARKTADELSRALSYKGLSWEDLPIIVRNPYFDNKFEEYKSLKRAALEERRQSQGRSIAE